jgi:hypothetical protein
MFASLLAGVSLTTNSQAGGHLTPTSYSSLCHPETVAFAAAPCYIVLSRAAQKHHLQQFLHYYHVAITQTIPVLLFMTIT